MHWAPRAALGTLEMPLFRVGTARCFRYSCWRESDRMPSSSLNVLSLFFFFLVMMCNFRSAGRKWLVKCLFVFGLTKVERAQVGEDVRVFRRAKHSCVLALQDVISEPEVRSGRTPTPCIALVNGTAVRFLNYCCACPPFI